MFNTCRHGHYNISLKYCKYFLIVYKTNLRGLHGSFNLHILKSIKRKWSTCSSLCSSKPMPLSLVSFPHFEECNQPCNCISHLLLIYINSWNRFLRFLRFSVTLSYYDFLIYKYRHVGFYAIHSIFIRFN
jgi:hypothetical protein